MDTNPVERLIRPLTLNRKNALFAGSDEGGTNWGTIASLIETCLCRDRHKHVYAARRTMPRGDFYPQGWLRSPYDWLGIVWCLRFSSGGRNDGYGRVFEQEPVIPALDG